MTVAWYLIVSKNRGTQINSPKTHCYMNDIATSKKIPEILRCRLKSADLDAPTWN